MNYGFLPYPHTRKFLATPLARKLQHHKHSQITGFNEKKHWFKYVQARCKKHLNNVTLLSLSILSLLSLDYCCYYIVFILLVIAMTNISIINIITIFNITIFFHTFIRRRQLNYLFYGQSGELCWVGRLQVSEPTHLKIKILIIELKKLVLLCQQKLLVKQTTSLYL